MASLVTLVRITPRRSSWTVSSRLEYRGYDSAGIAVVQDDHIVLRRDVGKLSNLARCLAEARWPGTSASGTHVGQPMASPASATPIPMPIATATWWSCRTASWRTSASCAPSWRPKALCSVGHRHRSHRAPHRPLLPAEPLAGRGRAPGPAASYGAQRGRRPLEP